MATSYHVYGNDGQGGPIDYSQPIATVPAAPLGSTGPLTFQPGPLPRPSDNRWGVRAFDDVSGIEEANTDARVRLILDAAGNDITAQPNGVVGLAARWSAGSLLLVSWYYGVGGQGGPPDHFDVFVLPTQAGSPPSPSGPPIQSVPANATGNTVGYACSLPNLLAPATGTVLVRAVGLTGINGPGVAVDLPPRGGQLRPVDALQAEAIP